MRISWDQLADNGSLELEARPLSRSRPQLLFQVLHQAILCIGIVRLEKVILLAVVEDVRAEEVARRNVGVLDQIEHYAVEDF